LSQTLTTLRAAAPHCVIIVLQLSGQSWLRNRCVELGADHVFDKTADLNELIGILRTIRKRKMEGDLAIRKRRTSSRSLGTFLNGTEG